MTKKEFELRMEANREKKRIEFDRMERLIITALDKWDIDDIMEVIHDRIEQSTRSSKDELNDKMGWLLSNDGYAVIKTKSIQDDYELQDFVRKNMCISTSEFNKNCLFPS